MSAILRGNQYTQVTTTGRRNTSIANVFTRASSLNAPPPPSNSCAIASIRKSSTEKIQAHHSQGPPQCVPSPDRTRDGEFWFEDGNTILVASDIEFRVYKGLLACRSPVLKHMLFPAVSQLQVKAAQNKPCSVVHLTDSPEDFRHLLRIYMPADNGSFCPDAPSYHMLSALVRMGHKYEIPQLVQNSLAYLKEYYPTSFNKWTACEHNAPPGFEAVHAIGVVNLARLTGELSLLPAALLNCCTLMSQLVSGFAREDGTGEELAPEDLSLCFSAKGKLIAETLRIAARVFAAKIPEASACTTRKECLRELQRMTNELHEHAALLVHPDPFEPLVDIYAEWDLCECCGDMVEERDVRERRAAWARLPGILGLAAVDGWGDDLPDECAGAGVRISVAEKED